MKYVILGSFQGVFRQMEMAFLQSDPNSDTLTKMEKRDFDGQDLIELTGQGT